MAEIGLLSKSEKGVDFVDFGGGGGEKADLLVWPGYVCVHFRERASFVAVWGEEAVGGAGWSTTALAVVSWLVASSTEVEKSFVTRIKAKYIALGEM